jgi:hypothetical protein
VSVEAPAPPDQDRQFDDDGLRDDDCISCGEGMPDGECGPSERLCGHHCNHSWTHDVCCWCHEEFGDEDDPGFDVGLALAIAACVVTWGIVIGEVVYYYFYLTRQL